MQLHGQIVAKDLATDPELGNVIGGTGGIVKSVATATVHQPDRVTMDANTGEELHRDPRPDLEVQQITVAWEDGTEGTLTELVDTWITLGSVIELPTIRGDVVPPGAYGELPEQKAEVDAAVARVGDYLAEVRAAAPYVAVRVEGARTVAVVDDGDVSLAE